jgi:glycosyltransferase involved in cell wall biosynthesis
MHPISVVIITKNEAANIENAILSAKTISEDIVVVDSGSTDETIAIAKRNGAEL